MVRADADDFSCHQSVVPRGVVVVFSRRLILLASSCAPVLNTEFFFIFLKITADVESANVFAKGANYVVLLGVLGSIPRGWLLQGGEPVAADLLLIQQFPQCGINKVNRAKEQKQKKELPLTLFHLDTKSWVGVQLRL